MAADELFLTVHPEAEKRGLRIDRKKYNLMREAILEYLRLHGSMTFTELGDLLEDELQKNFDGTVMLYYTTVKLDLEARGEIRRVPGSKPQLIEIV